MIYILRQWQGGMVSGLVSHLDRNAASFEILEAHECPTWPTLRRTDAIIGLGGPPSVCDLRAADYPHPFLLHEEGFLAEARRLSIPVLGICLTHQLLAAVEHQKVERSHRTTFGVQPVDLTEAGKGHWLFDGLPDRIMIYQHHQDHVTSLPATARLLGTSPSCAMEAVAWDDQTVSTQFHPEVLSTQVAMAIERFPRQLSDSGLTLEQMLNLVPADYRIYTERLFDNFLYRAGAIRRPSWKDRTICPVVTTPSAFSRRPAA